MLSTGICRFKYHCAGGRGGHGEMNLARVILNIVSVFVICHIPRYFIHISRNCFLKLSRAILAVIAVATVDSPVSCMRHQKQYYPPVYLLYAEVRWNLVYKFLLVYSSQSQIFFFWLIQASTFSSTVQLPQGSGCTLRGLWCAIMRTLHRILRLEWQDWLLHPLWWWLLFHTLNLYLLFPLKGITKWRRKTSNY